MRPRKYSSLFQQQTFPYQAPFEDNHSLRTRAMHLSNYWNAWRLTVGTLELLIKFSTLDCLHDFGCAPGTGIRTEAKSRSCCTHKSGKRDVKLLPTTWLHPHQWNNAALPGDRECIDRGAGIIDDLGRQSFAGNRKLGEAVRFDGDDNIGLAGGRRVEWSATAAHGEMGHAI
jgi:hypothetical protein